HAAVVLGRDEEHGVERLDLLLEIADDLRKVRFEVLVEQRQVTDLHDLEPERRLGKGDHRLGDLATERFLAKTADEYGDVAGGGHVRLLIGVSEGATLLA